MCMITVNVNDKRKKSLITDDDLKFIKEANVENPDGFGYYAWNKKKGEAEIGKFYPKTPDDKIIACLDKFNQNRNEYSFVITHSRLGTSGGKGLSQVHPISVIYPDKFGRNRYVGWFIIHNGILDNCGDLISDTQLYGYELGQWMYNHNIKTLEDITECKEYVEFFNNGMFKGSRVVLVYQDKYYIFNRDTGKEIGKYGDWHSGELLPHYPTYGCGYGMYGGYDDYYDDEDRYDLKPTQYICSIWNIGKPNEFAYVYDYDTQKTIKLTPHTIDVKVNELDWDPKKRVNK